MQFVCFIRTACIQTNGTTVSAWMSFYFFFVSLISLYLEYYSYHVTKLGQ